MSWQLMRYRAMKRAEEALQVITEYIYSEKRMIEPEQRLAEYLKRREMN